MLIRVPLNRRLEFPKRAFVRSEPPDAIYRVEVGDCVYDHDNHALLRVGDDGQLEEEWRDDTD